MQHFTFANFSLSLDANAALLNWLSEFLSPSFTPHTGTDADWQIKVRAFTAQNEQQHTALIKKDQEIETFTRDGTFEYLPYERNTDGQITLCVPDEALLATICSKNRVVSLALDATTRSARYFTMKILRELTTAHLVRNGYIPVHAAGLQLHSGATPGIALLGPKGVGKSTFLIAGLLQHQATFIANDRCFLKRSACHESGTRVKLFGMPTITKLRAESISLFPSLLEAISASGFDASKSIKECANQTTQKQQILHQGYKSLSAHQLCNLTGAPATQWSYLNTLIFLGTSNQNKHAHTSPTEGEWETLDAPALLAHIKANYLGIRTTPTKTEIRIPEAFQMTASDIHLHEHLERETEQIVDLLQGYYCQPASRTAGKASLDATFWQTLLDCRSQT